MIVHLKTLPLTPDDHPVTDAISALNSLVPAQIDQTRKQIAQLAHSPATQAALASTTSALGSAGALAGVAVAELAMSAIENKVYELTAPAIENSSTREAIVTSSREEVRMKAQGVDLQAAPESEIAWAADPNMARERENPLADLPSADQNMGSILEDAFGPKINRLREWHRAQSELSRPILSNSINRSKL